MSDENKGSGGNKFRPLTKLFPY
ncbi:MAG: hypothetical protein RLZZ444_4270, partial [Pseudomonadota bacterium]